MTKYASIIGIDDETTPVNHKSSFFDLIKNDKKSLFGLIILSVFVFFALFSGRPYGDGF